jgi:hypothetical protein
MLKAEYLLTAALQTTESIYIATFLDPSPGRQSQVFLESLETKV